MLFVFVAKAQSGGLLDARISLNVKDKTIPEVLDQIERLGNFSFTYNSDIISHKKRISLSVSNKPIGDVLQTILGASCVFTPIGEKIVISPLLESDFKSVGNKQIKKTIVQQIDTVKTVVYDTSFVAVQDTQHIVIRDTIRLIDTVRKVDTIRMLVKMPEASWQIGLLYSESAVTKSLQNQLSTAALGQQQLVSCMLYKHLKNIKIGLGVGMQQVFASVQYRVAKSFIDSSQSNEQSISYYRYRQAFSYYMFKDGDTVQIPVLDSTQTQLTAKTFTGVRQINQYQGINRYRFLIIPISFASNLWHNKKHLIDGELIIRPELMIAAQGSIVAENEQTFALKNSFPAFSMSGQFALNYSYSINSRTDICAALWGAFQVCNSYFKPQSLTTGTFWTGCSIGIKTMIGND